MAGTPSPKTVSTKLERIAELAKQMPGVALTSLSHHIDIDWLREAYRRTRKDGAVGVDGQTAQDYEANLETNLQTLLDRAKSGDHYRAPPVHRQKPEHPCLAVESPRIHSRDRRWLLCRRHLQEPRELERRGAHAAVPRATSLASCGQTRHL